MAEVLHDHCVDGAHQVGRQFAATHVAHGHTAAQVRERGAAPGVRYAPNSSRKPAENAIPCDAPASTTNDCK